MSKSPILITEHKLTEDTTPLVSVSCLIPVKKEGEEFIIEF